MTDWKHTDIDWIRVDIRRDDLRRFTERSNVKGLCHALAFLLLIASTGALAYCAFSSGHWVLLALALYVHGTFYSMFGYALHELSHNTVFASRFLNVIHIKAMLQNLGRLFTLTPTSMGWRGRAFKQDTWEQFVLKNANDKELGQLRRFSVACRALVGRALRRPAPRRRD